MLQAYSLAERAGWLLGVAILGCVWLAVWALGAVDPRVLPPPHTVLATLLTDLQTFETWQNILVTLQAWALAVPIGFFSAAAVAIGLAMSPSGFRALQPYILIMNAVPRLVLAPIFILGFGLGISSRVALGVSLIVFPVILGIHGALRLVDPALLASVAGFGASGRALWWHVRLPSALPFLVANWRLATGLGLLGAIVGEILVAPNGLGWLLRIRAGVFDVAGVFSVLVIVLGLALLVSVITDFFSARLLKWQ